MLKKIISGGQTGVDQAALQAAIDSGLEHGGWCPPGRVCESGFIPSFFELTETPLECDPSAPETPRSQRTIWNVRDSDGSLFFFNNDKYRLKNDKGTYLALETSRKLHKPYLFVNHDNANIKKIITWITENTIKTLSVGGPSEGNCPGVYNAVYVLLMKFIEKEKAGSF